MGMDNRTAISRVGALKSFVRVVRGFAEASLVVPGFALAILLIGTPLALVARGVHDALSWLVALRGETSALTEAFIPVSSVIGTIILAAVLVRLLVGFFNWRRRFRVRGSRGRGPKTRLNPHEAAAFSSPVRSGHFSRDLVDCT
jgi:hypothetical protein